MSGFSFARNHHERPGVGRLPPLRPEHPGHHQKPDYEPRRYTSGKPGNCRDGRASISHRRGDRCRDSYPDGWRNQVKHLRCMSANRSAGKLGERPQIGDCRPTSLLSDTGRSGSGRIDRGDDGGMPQRGGFETGRFRGGPLGKPTFCKGLFQHRSRRCYGLGAVGAKASPFATAACFTFAPGSRRRCFGRDCRRYSSFHNGRCRRFQLARRR